MAEMRLVGFPVPPDGEIWCALCVALAKGRWLTDPERQEAIRKGLEDEDRAVFTVRARTADLLADLDIAITRGVNPQMGPAVLPLCWRHAPAIDPSPPAEEEPAPPPLFRGHGGLN